MALTVYLAENTVGVPFVDAYARILNFGGDRESVRYHVAVYATKEARDAGRMVVSSFVFDCPTPTGEILPGLYAHLKSQPGFEAAKDC